MQKIVCSGVLAAVLTIFLALITHGVAQAQLVGDNCRQDIYNVALSDDDVYGELSQIVQDQHSGSVWALTKIAFDLPAYTKEYASAISAYNTESTAQNCSAMYTGFPASINAVTIDTSNEQNTRTTMAAINAEHHSLMWLWYQSTNRY